MTDTHSISLHREAIATGFPAEVQQVLSSKQEHTNKASCAFDTARTRISGSDERNKEDIKVTRKILNQHIRFIKHVTVTQLLFHITHNPKTPQCASLLSLSQCCPCFENSVDAIAKVLYYFLFP